MGSARDEREILKEIQQAESMLKELREELVLRTTIGWVAVKARNIEIVQPISSRTSTLKGHFEFTADLHDRVEVRHPGMRRVQVVYWDADDVQVYLLGRGISIRAFRKRRDAQIWASQRR